jgi:uncharacterized SAM-binding protein YcdF (DUF218 family)
LSSKLKKRMRLALAGLALLAMAVPLGWLAAPRLLRVDTGAPASVDAVVVLGGEPCTRPERAAKVYHATHPPLVIVSGYGDCEDVRRLLEARAVPQERILTECESHSTFDNARFSVKLLRERHVTNAVIVTSWFHSRRALASFRSAAPEIQFYSQPTPIPSDNLESPEGPTRSRVLREYVKLVYYWVAHGVGPGTG